MMHKCIFGLHQGTYQLYELCDTLEGEDTNEEKRVHYIGMKFEPHAVARTRTNLKFNSHARYLLESEVRPASGHNLTLL